MAAMSKPGTGRGLTTSSAHRRPYASVIASRTGAGRTAAPSTRSSCSSTDRTALTLQPLDEPGAQLRPVLGVLEGVVDEGADVAAGVAEVVASAPVHHDVHRVALGDQQLHGVSELQLAPRARGDPVERVEDRDVEEVTTGRGERGRRLLGGRLLDHAVDLLDVLVVGVADVEHAVRGDLLARDVERAEHAAAVPV